MRRPVLPRFTFLARHLRGGVSTSTGRFPTARPGGTLGQRPLATAAGLALALRGAIGAVEGAVAAGDARRNAAVIAGQWGYRRARPLLLRRELFKTLPQYHIDCTPGKAR